MTKYAKGEGCAGGMAISETLTKHAAELLSMVKHGFGSNSSTTVRMAKMERNDKPPDSQNGYERERHDMIDMT